MVINKEFIEKNLQEVPEENKYKFRCIDWRPGEDKKNDSLSHFPWSNVWHFSSLLATIEFFSDLNDEDRKKIYDAYIEFIWWEDKFFFHTANGHLAEIKVEWKPIIKTWCWHMKLLLNTDEYWISLDNKKFIYNVIKNIPESNIETLTWWHEEKWIIVIENYNKEWKLVTVPNNIEWTSYFVYDKWHVYNVNKEFSKFFVENFSNLIINEEDFEKTLNETCDKHFEITGLHLAKDLPIYTI